MLFAGVTLATRASADKAACISAADQGQQLRDDGKYRAARERFVTCSKADCPKVISGSCAQWLRDLDASMPSVVLGAKDPGGADITDVTVSLDGETLTDSLDGKPIPVDPGSHKLHFEHEGSEPTDVTILLRAGEKNRNVAPVLVKKSTKVAALTTETPTTPETPQPKPAGDGSQTARLAVGITLGVVAAGALGTGIYFGLASQSDADNAAQIRSTMPTSACLGAGASTQSCQNLASAVDAQNREATISVAMYVASGVLATVSVLSLILWPSHKRTEPTNAWLVPLVGPTTGAAMGGAF